MKKQTKKYALILVGLILAAFPGCSNDYDTILFAADSDKEYDSPEDMENFEDTERTTPEYPAFTPDTIEDINQPYIAMVNPVFDQNYLILDIMASNIKDLQRLELHIKYPGGDPASIMNLAAVSLSDDAADFSLETTIANSKNSFVLNIFADQNISLTSDKALIGNIYFTLTGETGQTGQPVEINFVFGKNGSVAYNSKQEIIALDYYGGLYHSSPGENE